MPTLPGNLNLGGKSKTSSVTTATFHDGLWAAARRVLGCCMTGGEGAERRVGRGLNLTPKPDVTVLIHYHLYLFKTMIGCINFHKYLFIICIKSLFVNVLYHYVP